MVILDRLSLCRSLGTITTTWAYTFDFCGMEQTVEPVGCESCRNYFKFFLDKVRKKLVAKGTRTGIYTLKQNVYAETIFYIFCQFICWGLHRLALTNSAFGRFCLLAAKVGGSKVIQFDFPPLLPTSRTA